MFARSVETAIKSINDGCGENFNKTAKISLIVATFYLNLFMSDIRRLIIYYGLDFFRIRPINNTVLVANSEEA